MTCPHSCTCDNSSKLPVQTDKTLLYITLDPSHMIKNARNLVAKYVIRDANGKNIEWKYFVKLVEFQDILKRKIGSVKMTKKHLDYEQNKMSVHIAAETLSDSVYIAFMFLKTEQIDDFQDVDATSVYVNYFNLAWAIINYDFDDDMKGFKCPLTPETNDISKQFTANLTVYLQGLSTTFKGKTVNILQSPLKTAYLGFICTLNSVIGLYEDMLSSTIVKQFCTHRVSQDFLENRFGRIRQRNGHNPNPNTVEFTAAMKKLLFENEVKGSQYTNCRHSDIPILTISSAKNSSKSSLSQKQQHQTSQQPLLPVRQQTAISDQLNIEPNHQKIRDKLIDFDAARLEKQLSNQIKCEVCKKSCFAGQKVFDNYVDLMREKTNVEQPTIDTVEILKIADTYVSSQVKDTNDFDTVVESI